MDSTQRFIDAIFTKNEDAINEALHIFVDEAILLGMVHKPTFFSITTIVHIAKFLEQETAPILEIIKGEQTLHTYKFSDLFNIMNEQDFHTLTNNKGHTYHCDYHRESLAAHSLLSMINMIDQIGDTVDENTLFRMATTALFHDIGKVVTAQMIDTGKAHVSGFPAHGEIGAYILNQLWHSDLNIFFTAEHWRIFVRTVCTHMCGYHSTACSTEDLNEFDRYRLNLLRLEEPEVKNCLYYLSHADNFAAIPDPKIVKDYTKFLSSRCFFKQYVVDTNFDEEAYIKTSAAVSGTLVYMIGSSGSGKSYLGHELVKYLIDNEFPTDRVKLISRDDYMLTMTAKKLGIDLPEDTKMVYKQIYNEYKKLGNEWRQLINDKIKKDVDSLLALNGVVILDSVMNMFSFNALLPIRAKHSRKITVLCSRSSLYDQLTADRLGMTIAEQLNVVKTHTIRNPFGAKSFKHFRSLASCNRQSDADRFIMLATVVHPVSWTSGTDLLKKHLLMFAQMGKTMDNIDTDEMHINELVTHLVDTIGYNSMCRWFTDRLYTAKTIGILKGTVDEQKAVRIVYHDRNPLWKPTWARETRGVVLIDINGQWEVLSRRLARGMEVVSGYHIEKTEGNDFETQDISSFKDLSHVDDAQLKTITYLLSKPTPDELDNAINGVLTSKADGSFMSVTCLTGRHKEIVEEWISIYGSNFEKMVMKLATDKGLSYLPVIGTKGCFLSGEMMWNYILTSMAMVYTKTSFAELQNIYNESIEDGSSGNLFSVMVPAMSIFLDKVNALRNKMAPNLLVGPSMTLSFEVICTNRRSVDSVHTEFTVSYPYSAIRFLGFSANCGESMGVYRAHFQLPGAESVFDCPLYWYVYSPYQVSRMIEGISMMFRVNADGSPRMTKDMYMSEFPAENYGKTHHDELDAEGFVFYHMDQPVKKIKYVNRADLNYCKAKTLEYYDFHKPRPHKFKDLMTLADHTGTIFPAFKTIKDFFGNISTHGSSFFKYIETLLIEVTADDAESHFIIQSIPEKARIGLYRRKGVAQRAPIILNTSSVINSTLFDIFNDIFNIDSMNRMEPELRAEVGRAIRGLIMSVRPWMPDYNDRFDKMVATFDRQILNMFGLLLQGESH